MLTLFTTPVIYIYLDRVRERLSRRKDEGSTSRALVPVQSHEVVPYAPGE